MFKQFEVIFNCNDGRTHVSCIIVAKTPKKAIRLGFDYIRRFEKCIAKENNSNVEHDVNSISQFHSIKQLER